MKRLFFIAAVLFSCLSIDAQTYFGDVDKDGNLDIGDVQCLSDMVLGKTTADKILGDVNRDNKVDVDDIAALVAVLIDPTKAVIAYDCVDLGLSVKWATCNVGTASPEGYGDYFAWGETAPKTDYNSKWSNYFDTTDGGTTFVKYTGSKTVLDTTDDAASVNWGGSWRMPTDSEWSELRTGCFWDWTEDYDNKGVSGYIIYKVKDDSDKGLKRNDDSTASPTGSYSLADSHIFLPAAGYYYNKKLSSDVGFWGWYWSGSLDKSRINYAWGTSFSSAKVQEDENKRFYGKTVRPVCPK